ncbi:MAG: IS21 family transposase [Balneolaceae bacterium]
MAAKTIRMDQIRNLLQQKNKGISIRTIARNTGLSRNTVRHYLRAVDQHGYSPQQALSLDDEQLSRLCQNTEPPSAGEPRQQDLLGWITSHGNDLRKKHVTRQLLWEEYRQRYPDGYGYTWFCRHLNDYLGNKDLTMIFEHRPGEKMMADFAGDRLSYIDPETGEVIETQVWVSVLPFSSYMYVEAVESQKQEDVAGCFQRTVGFFEGVPQCALFDNFRSVVKRADRYEPTFTELMDILAVHYQCSFMATRIRKPRDKASVETAVNVVYRRIYAKLRHQTFYSLAELNGAIAIALAELNNRPFKGKEHSRRDLFESYEKPLLGPLPTRKLILWRRSQVKIQKNYHVILGQDMHQYSVPYRFAGKPAKIYFTPTDVEIYLDYKRIAVHRRNTARYGYTTLAEHMPPNHLAIHKQKGWDRDYFLARAGRIGPATRHAISVMLSTRAFPEQTYNACLGVFRLADSYSGDRLEAVCKLLEGSPKITYRLIHTMLKNNRDQHFFGHSDEDSITPDHPNLRGPDNYR